MLLFYHFTTKLCRDNEQVKSLLEQQIFPLEALGRNKNKKTTTHTDSMYDLRELSNPRLHVCFGYTIAVFEIAKPTIHYNPNICTIVQHTVLSSE